MINNDKYYINIDKAINVAFDGLTEEQKFNLIYRHPVTGLYNRNAFTEAQSRCASGVAMIDMDSLKYINDTAGHQVGDSCIRRLGDTLGGIFGLDVTFHLSGDEFTIMFDDEVDFEAKMLLVKARCGVGFSYGFSIKGDLKEADLHMLENKRTRQEQGLRVDRGERPPWYEKVVG